ncbi:thymidylate kinase [Streptomyces orinoci]|uniref:Thymidylate kinase n=1 Tax=Streptomyces orinoci TaxID=67339 RepID=A0ABV3JVP1_STRON|nr:thymidylate kinase [Streptomyces orinoci]
MSRPTAYAPLTYDRAQGSFTVFEGLSGVGKTTITQTIATRQAAGSLHTLLFPHSGWSALVNKLLLPLPQFAFYLSGLLHASDIVRKYRQHGPVVADRYVSSVAACHAAVHDIPLEEVTRLLEPYRPYLETPDQTFYLRCCEDELRRRLAAKERHGKLTADDAELFSVPGRLRRLVANFDAVAEADPTAIVVDTDDKNTDELGDWITSRMEALRA